MSTSNNGHVVPNPEGASHGSTPAPATDFCEQQPRTRHGGMAVKPYGVSKMKRLSRKRYTLAIWCI